MNDISVGAVGAAIIAGLVSLLGLIIGKEQKVSEFRQAWINDLRKCLIDYLVNINAISDSIRTATPGQPPSPSLLTSYKLLNEANHGIALRINPTESPSQELLASMAEFESIATSNATLTPAKIKQAESKFVSASKELLKFEWKRVKRGENAYVWTKRVVFVALILMLLLMNYLWFARSADTDQGGNRSGTVVVESPSLSASCPPVENRSVERVETEGRDVEGGKRRGAHPERRRLPSGVANSRFSDKVCPGRVQPVERPSLPALSDGKPEAD